MDALAPLNLKRRGLLRASLCAASAMGGAGLGAGLGIGPARAAAKTVHIGTQKGVTLYLLRDKGSLENVLAPLGYTPVFTEFPGGPQLLEALNAGAIDFGTVGEAPPIFAQAAGAPLLYVGYEPSAPKGEAIIVQKGSPIRTLAALKGKTVALNRGSNVNYLLVRALESAGLTYADIKPAYLAPSDARAAFEQGSVDAWAIWDPYLAAAEAATQARVLADGTGLVANREFLIASRRLVAAAPQAVSAILAQLNDVDLWARAHQKEAAALLAPGIGLPPAIVETFLGRTGFGVNPMTAAVAADQQKIADAFYKLGLIPKPIAVAGAVWARPA